MMIDTTRQVRCTLYRQLGLCSSGEENMTNPDLSQ